MNPEDISPESDHIEAPIGTDADNGSASKDRSSVNRGDVEGDSHDSNLVRRDVNSNPITVGNIAHAAGVAIGPHAQSTLTQQFFNIFQGTSPETSGLRNRAVMLKRVRDYWIEGVLEQSLYESILIKLGKTVKPDAIITPRPWHITIQTAQQKEQRVTQNKPIIDIFDEMEQSLLILGEPGSGKTTTLLELARDLIKRAESNPTYPLPVVFNLSSWADKRKSIAEWLVEELISRYTIPQKLAQAWIENDTILPLLDGLDEVAEAYRNECVTKLNQFRQERANVLPLVVCCRVAEYALLPTRLELQNAILIEPLTLPQITDYFDELGDEFRTVKQAVEQEPELQTLGQSPLMLNVMAVALGGMKPEVLQAFHLAGNYQQELFNRYIQKIFTYRGDIASPYPHKRILSWLAWLAKNLAAHEQTIFLLELMQRSWLLTKTQQRSYRLSVGMIRMLILWLIVVLGGALMFGQSRALIRGLIFWVSGGWKDGLDSGVILMLLICLLCGPIFVFEAEEYESIEPVHQLKWSSENSKLTLIWGPLIVLLFVMSRGLYWGLIFGLIAGLIVVLLGGRQSMTIESQTALPNQGIRQSGYNGLLVGVSSALVSGLILGLIFEVSNGLIGGLMFGLSGGLLGGGQAWIKHYVLRYILYLSDSTPWNYSNFLDSCADRMFLRKVGGGYIFIHRMLMEHFAQLTEEDIQRLTSE